MKQLTTITVERYIRQGHKDAAIVADMIRKDGRSESFVTEAIRIFEHLVSLNLARLSPR